MNSVLGENLKPGMPVRVKSATEIAATLDGQGTLEGLPFMPEMLQFCGKRFVVAARLDKTCVEGCGVRQFQRGDVFILEGVRCDGQSHRGCAVSCAVLWKRAWLSGDSRDQHVCSHAITNSEIGALKATSDPGVMFCQSTQLRRATRSVPPLRLAAFLLKDLVSGNANPLAVTRAVARELRSLVVIGWAVLSLRRRKDLPATPRRNPGSDRSRTPVIVLGLQPGDLVHVKTKEEIQATLDSHSKNRGLKFTSPMYPYCGGTYRVRARLDTVIREIDGKLMQIHNTVLLEDVVCKGLVRCVACPRAQYLWWREAWLTKLHVKAPQPKTAGEQP